MDKITALIVVSAALADSVNPCEIGILTMALLHVVFRFGRQKVLPVGLCFALGVAVSYFSFGVLVGHIMMYVKYIRFVVGILAIALAAPRLYYGLTGRELKLSPTSVRPIVSGLLSRGNTVYALLAGLAAGFVLMPCSSGPYFVILSLLSHDLVVVRLKAYLWLALYNLVVVSPLVLVTLGAYLLIDVSRIREYREKIMPGLEFASALMLLALGLYVLTQP
ncbi:cytochrome C biogenesis protein [Coprothermobacteraceae bacterium]|nr:cytochrome C biogenesis protein [Coprothermobacteraceae bacterium]